jgi:hypothetical protein
MRYVDTSKFKLDKYSTAVAVLEFGEYEGLHLDRLSVVKHKAPC